LYQKINRIKLGKENEGEMDAEMYICIDGMLLGRSYKKKRKIG